MYIFISYAGKEGLKYADILNRVLLDGGHQTFLFRNDVSIEDRLYSKIGKALVDCKIAVIIITEESHSSTEQEREYNVSCSLNKEVGIIKEGVELGAFTLLRGKRFKRFNESNVTDILKDFLKEINKFPESKILSVNEKKEMTPKKIIIIKKK